MSGSISGESRFNSFLSAVGLRPDAKVQAFKKEHKIDAKVNDLAKRMIDKIKAENPGVKFTPAQLKKMEQNIKTSLHKAIDTSIKNLVNNKTNLSYENVMGHAASISNKTIKDKQQRGIGQNLLSREQSSARKTRLEQESRFMTRNKELTKLISNIDTETDKEKRKGLIKNFAKEFVTVQALAKKLPQDSPCLEAFEDNTYWRVDEIKTFTKEIKNVEKTRPQEVQEEVKGLNEEIKSTTLDMNNLLKQLKSAEKPDNINKIKEDLTKLQEKAKDYEKKALGLIEEALPFENSNEAAFLGGFAISLGEAMEELKSLANDSKLEARIKDLSKDNSQNAKKEIESLKSKMSDEYLSDRLGNEIADLELELAKDEVEGNEAEEIAKKIESLKAEQAPFATRVELKTKEKQLVKLEGDLKKETNEDEKTKLNNSIDITKKEIAGLKKELGLAPKKSVKSMGDRFGELKAKLPKMPSVKLPSLSKTKEAAKSTKRFNLKDAKEKQLKTILEALKLNEEKLSLKQLELRAVMLDKEDLAEAYGKKFTMLNDRQKLLTNPALFGKETQASMEQFDKDLAKLESRIKELETEKEVPVEELPLADIVEEPPEEEINS